MTSVRYTTSLDGVTAEQLEGFFEGWPNPPSPARHLQLLHGSAHVVLAIEAGSDRVLGFINALSDGTLSAFVPLLEVRPECRRHGIGSELVRRMLDRLADHYSIDLMCDADVMPFYERLGLSRMGGMAIRFRENAG